MNKINAKWHFLKDDDEYKSPVCVKVARKLTTAQRKIAEEYATHIENKISNLTKSPPDSKENAVKIFKKLVTRVDKDFKFNEVQYKEVYKTVSGIKNSKSRGENELSNCFLCEIPQ